MSKIYHDADQVDPRTMLAHILLKISCYQLLILILIAINTSILKYLKAANQYLHCMCFSSTLSGGPQCHPYLTLAGITKSIEGRDICMSHVKPHNTVYAKLSFSLLFTETKSEGKNQAAS